MTSYELIFEGDQINEDTEDAILESDLDAVIVTGTSAESETMVTVTADGPTAIIAGHAAASELVRLGLRIRRSCEDLVTRSNIASRAGKTPQAVNLWVSGERKANNPFPRPAYRAANGLWLWGDVAEWLKSNTDYNDNLSYPTLLDHTRLNHWIYAQGKIGEVARFSQLQYRATGTATSHVNTSPLFGKTSSALIDIEYERQEFTLAG
jgi:transcriptional regulator with XRE-family HTH domain